jgi:4-amino-4-deoxy-L-arabinose transferase-like glycosyltransferase
VLLLPFAGLLRLANPDEPRDCEIGREWADGVWTWIPHFNGVPYTSKPPAFHWSAGAVMAATGSQEEWTGKVAAGLWGIACVAATAALGERLLGPGLGLLSGLVLLSMHMFQARFRIGTTDTALAALTAIAFLAFHRAHARAGVGGWILFGLAAGAAALAKGAHGLLFPVAAAAAFLAIRREWRLLPRLGVAALAGAAVFGAWCAILVGVESEGGSRALLEASLFGNIAKRFGERAHHSGGPLHYLVLLPRSAPWVLAAAAGAWAALAARGPERDRLLGPLLWIGVTVLGLSLATGKRTVYLLPVLPAVALLAAAAVDAAARGALAAWPRRLAAWTVEILASPLRLLPWARRGLRERAVLGCAVAALLSLAWTAAVTAPGTERDSGAAFARAAADAAGDRKLVLFRQDRGEAGMFLFPLRRTIPAVLDEEGLRAASGGRTVAVIADVEEVDRAIARGRLSAGLVARWKVLIEGEASETRYRVYAWDGR